MYASTRQDRPIRQRLHVDKWHYTRHVNIADSASLSCCLPACLPVRCCGVAIGASILSWLTRTFVQHRLCIKDSYIQQTTSIIFNSLQGGYTIELCMGKWLTGDTSEDKITPCFLEVSVGKKAGHFTSRHSVSPFKRLYAPNTSLRTLLMTLTALY